jgi:hypothetical protein
MKYPAFVVIYHYRPIRDLIMYDGTFSENLKVVYIRDNSIDIQKVYGLEIMGYYCGRDVDPQIENFVRSRIRLLQENK